MKSGRKGARIARELPRAPALGVPREPTEVREGPEWLRAQIAELTTSLEADLSFRENRVTEIRQAIAEDRYQVDTRSLAAAILHRNLRE